MKTKNRRFIARVGKRIVVTEVTVTQTVIPAVIQFADILDTLDRAAGYVGGEFHGYAAGCLVVDGDDPDEIARQVASTLADYLVSLGVEVKGRE